MPDMLQELTSLGLKEKHAKIYAAALQLGTGTVAQLAEKSGIKRPTVHLQLEEMVSEGLMTKMKLNKKTLYKPRDPVLFERGIIESQNSIEKLKIEYQQSRTSSGMPQVTVYDGLENVRQLYEELSNANFIRFWSSLSEVHPILYKEYMQLSEKMKERSINTKEIIPDTKEAKRNSRHLGRIAGPSYSARTIPFEELQNDSAVTNAALYIFRLHEFNFFAVKIEDPTIAATYRALFDMAWKEAKPF